jgi:ATP-binding cassette subfamily B protein
MVPQHNATDCGPAALATVAAFYGKRTSLARLRDLAGTDRRGTTLAGLCNAAEEIGFRARAVRATREALAQTKLPAIAHWHESERSHFVVLFRATRKRVIVGDPAAGIRKLSCADFHRNWTGVLLLVTPTAHFRQVSASRSPFSRLSQLLLPHHHLILDAFTAAVLMTILGLTTPFFIQALVDSVLVLGRIPALNWLGLGLLLVTFSRAGFLGLRSYLLAHLSHRIEAATVLGYYRHPLGLPLTFFQSRNEVETLARIHDTIRFCAGPTAAPLGAVTDLPGAASASKLRSERVSSS